MRSYQVFAAMSPEDASRFLKTLSDEVPTMFNQALLAASAAMKARPVYLKRQPFEKRASAVRRALSRVAANPVADEVLAVYFLDCKKDLLTEWLDLIGLEHEDGALKDDLPKPPPNDKLTEFIEKYLGADGDADRGLLLRAFAAQEAVNWPTLDESFNGDT